MDIKRRHKICDVESLTAVPVISVQNTTSCTPVRVPESKVKLGLNISFGKFDDL